MTQKLTETFYNGDSGNRYHIIHGWIERSGKDFYYFSLMNESTKGNSFIIAKDKSVRHLSPFDIGTYLQYNTSQIQSRELCDFVKHQFKINKN